MPVVAGPDLIMVAQTRISAFMRSMRSRAESYVQLGDNMIRKGLQTNRPELVENGARWKAEGEAILRELDAMRP